MADSPLHSDSDAPLTPSPAPGAAAVADAVDTPIFVGNCSMWLGFKSFAVGALLEVAGVALAIMGALNKGASAFGTPLMVVGVALLMASSLMIVWVILRVRAQRYKITRRLIEREQGLLVKRVDTLDLARVKDVELKQTLVDRMLNIGTLEIISTDRVAPNMCIDAIPNPRPIYEELRDAVIEIGRKRGVIPMN